MMIVEWDGREYPLDLDAIDFREAGYIKKHTKLAILELEDGINALDPDALGAIYWLMMKQNRRTMDFATINFNVPAFGRALVLARAKELGIDLDNPEDPEEQDEAAPKDQS